MNDFQRQAKRRRGLYLEWLLLSAEERVELGVPRSQAEYARVKGVVKGTLQAWQKRPDFRSELAARRAAAEADAALQDAGVRRLELERLAALLREEEGPTDPRTRRKPVGEFPSLPEAVGKTAVGGFAEYQKVKETVLRRAQEDDAKMIELWIKTWGKPFLDAEQEMAESPFTGLDDGQVVKVLLDQVPDEWLLEAVAARGLS